MSTEYFETRYRSDPDPWGFDRHWYEHRKFALTMAILARPRYRRAVEAGCANGALTERLADRCDEVIAFDFVESSVSRAAQRLRVATNVVVRCETFPQWWPPGSGDLVVWSEVAYYLTDEGLAEAERGLQRWLNPGGEVVAVHYTGTTDHPRSGRSVARWLDGLTFLRRSVSVLDERFEAGTWIRVSDGGSDH